MTVSAELIRLADAIRQGAKYRPQGFGGFYSHFDNAVCSCAIGAGVEGFLGKKQERPSNYFVIDLIDRFCPTILDPQYAVPQEEVFALAANPGAHDRLAKRWSNMKGEPIALFSVIVALNDEYYWTREHIADWLTERAQALA